jgi:hypothetical protein
MSTITEKIKASPYWAPFERSYEALRTSASRQRAIDWILQGDVASYTAWALGEGFEEAYGAESQEFRLGHPITGNRDYVLNPHEAQARALFSPLPLDEVFIYKKDEVCVLKEPGFLIECQEKILLLCDPIAYWGMTPYEILLRDGSPQVFEAWVLPLLQNKNPLCADIWSRNHMTGGLIDRAKRDALSGWERYMHTTHVSEGKNQASGGLKERRRSKEYPFPISFVKTSSIFFILGQGLGCDRKAALAARLFMPDTANHYELFGTLTWEHPQFIPELVQAVLGGTSAEVIRTMDRIEKLEHKHDAFHTLVSEVLDNTQDIVPGTEPFGHMEHYIQDGAGPLKAQRTVEDALRKGYTNLARLLFQALPVTLEYEEDEYPKRVVQLAHSIQEHIHLETKVKTVPVDKSAVKQRL